MKKILGLLSLAVLFANPVSADCGCGQAKCREVMIEKGGFVGEALKPISIEEAKKLPDESLVMLQGKITKRISNDEYEFSDGKHKTVVEIDDDDWNGVKVSPKNKVEIEGETDKDLTSFKIEVKSISKIH